MQTYVSPIGYDTRRITRPLINRGLGVDDRLLLLRPETESDTQRAEQAIADIEQFLQEIEPACSMDMKRVMTESFEETVRSCCEALSNTNPDHELVVSLSGGARDILLPLTVASLVYARRIDTTLFFSDLDSSVKEWKLPDLTANVPDRALSTFDTIVTTNGWLTLTSVAEATDQSKSTVIRHVNELEEAGVLESDTSEKAKRVRVTFSGELLQKATRVSRKE